MTSHPHKIDISQSPAPLHIKFALVCLSKPPLPKWFGYLCFILSHLQAFAVIIKSSYIALPDNTPSSSPIIQFFLKFFVIGGWLSHDRTAPLLAGTIISTLYIVKMLVLLAYILSCLYKKRRVHDLVQKYWSVLHTVHPLAIFFWIHTFSLEIIKYSQQYNFSGGAEFFMTVMAYINTIFNSLFAMVFSRIAVKYKTKDVTSSKTSLLETKSVIFKILIPILWISAENNQSIQIWTLVLILISSLLGDWILIKNLPYYRIPVLLLSTCLQAAQMSLALVVFIVKLLPEDHGMFSVQVTWLLIAPVMIKAYYVVIWKILLFISGAEVRETKNVAYLIHKRATFLYFLKSRKIIDEGVNKLAFSDIIYQARLAYVVKASGLSFAELDKSKSLLVKTLKNLSLMILEMYPDAFLAQINLAYFYFKYEDLYLVAYNLIEDVLARDPKWNDQISLYMFRFKLQKKLMMKFSQKSREGLDFEGYVRSQDLYQQVRNNMEKQAKTQLSFWEEFLVNKPDMLKLKRIALEVKSQKKIVQESWRNLSKVRSASFLAPLLVYGMYSSLINNDSIEGEKYIEQSQEDAKKLKRLFKVNELNNNTAFSEKTVRVVVSGSKLDLGRILDCSTNISESYGWHHNEIKGKPIEFLMPSFYRVRHNKFLKTHYSTGKSKILNKTVALPVKTSNGYIHPSWIHRKVSPIMEHGISYIALVKPFRSNERMVLVRNDGKIDDMSFEFAEEMNLLGVMLEKESLNLSMLCPEFQQVNDAFNQVANDLIGDLEVYKINFSSRTKKSLNTQISSQKIIEKNVIPERNQETQGNISIFATTRMTERPFLVKGKTIEGSHLERSNLKIHIEKFYQNNLLVEEDDTQEIYNNFTRGSTLAFYPAKNNGYSMKTKNTMWTTLKPVTYNVKISNRIYEKYVIKFVMLEKISHADTDSVQSSDGRAASKSSNIDSPENKKNGGQAELISPTFPSQGKVQNLNLSLQKNEGPTLSILDELESNDLMARKIVSRRFGKDKDHVGLAAPQQNNQDMSFSYLSREDVEVSFDPQKEQNRSPSLMTNIEAEPNSTNRGLIKLEKKRKEPLNIMDLHKEENSIASSYISRGKKVQHIVTQALKIDSKKKSAKLYTYSFVGFVMAMALLLGLQTFHLYVGIQEVENQIPVISTAFFRQNFMISSAAALRMWDGVLRGAYTTGNWLNDNHMWKFALQYYLEELSKYNKEFYQYLDKVSTKAQSRFYEKNVGIYETKTLISMSSTSEAFQMMIEKEYSCVNMEIPLSFSSNIDDSDFIYLLDNMLNDLLIQSQKQIDGLIGDLDELNSSTTRKMICTLAIVLIICLIFLGVSIRFLYAIASEAKFFMITIFQIKPQDCENIQRVIKNFISALKMNNMKEFDLFLDERPSKEKKKNHSLRFRSGSMESLYRIQRTTFMKILPNFLLFICWSIVYFVISSNFITNIDSSKTQIEAALQAGTNQSLTFAEMADITLTNGTAIVKNKTFMSDLLVNLESFKDTNSLVSKFRDKNGDLTALQEKVLFSFPCQELLTFAGGKFSNTYLNCLNVAKGETSIGLVDANLQFYTNVKNLLETFENSPKTKEDLAAIFLMGLAGSTDVGLLIPSFLEILYESTYQRFREEVDFVRKETIYLAVFILVVSSIGTIMTWKWVVKKIFRIQKVDWHILQVVPVNLILKNKHLQQYLLKHSDGELDGVKRFLG